MDQTKIRFIFLAWSFRSERILHHLVQMKKIPLIVFQLKKDLSSLDGFCQKHSIEYHRVETIHNKEIHNKMKSLKPDLMLLGNYCEILSDEEINIARLGAIVTHDGKLPEARGSSLVNWMLINNEAEGGASIFRAEPELDVGFIVYQERYRITEDDDAATLLDKNIEIYCRGLTKIFADLENNALKEMPQDVSKVGFYRKRYPKDGLLDLNSMSPGSVHNYVRALVEPYPGAFSYYNGEKVVFRKTSLTRIDNSVCLNLPEGKIWLLQIESEGKEGRVNALDFFEKDTVDCKEFETCT